MYLLQRELYMIYPHFRGRFLPAVGDGDNSGAVFSNLKEHGHGEVEVGSRRVAPPTIVVWKSEIGRTEVGPGNENGGTTRVAPPRVVGALDFKTCAAA